MPQICVRFSDEDYAEIEQMAADSNTTRPRVVSRLVKYAIRQEQLAFADVQDEIDSVNQARDQLTHRIMLLEQQLQDSEKQLRDRESDLGFLRQEYAKLNDALSQRLLAEAQSKKSWSDRLLGH